MLASVLTEAVLVGLFASVVGLGVGIVLSSGLKAVLDAFGFDIPAGGTVVSAQTVIVALARRDGRHDHLGDRAGPEGVARPADRGDARRRHRGATALGPPGPHRDRDHRCSACSPCSRGCSADQGIQFVGLGAFIVFIGVFVLGPAVARPLSDWIGWPAARLRGITGALARDNAMRNPKRTSATAAALMIGVALVGFITIFAASAKESIDAQVDESFKADYVISTGSGFGAAFGGFSPQLATDIAAAARRSGRRARCGSTRPSSTARAGSSPASTPARPPSSST